MLIGSSGNATLDGSRSGGADAFLAKAGATQIISGYGPDRFFAGSGAAMVMAGTGAAVFGFVNSSAGGAVSVVNFNTAIDQVYFQGYAPGTVAAAFWAATVAQGSATVILPDQTRIIFVGMADLTRVMLTG